MAGGGGVDADVSGVVAGSRFAATAGSIAWGGAVDAVTCGADAGGLWTDAPVSGAQRTTGAFRTRGRGARCDTIETTGE